MRTHLRRLIAAPDFPQEDREMLIEHLLQGMAKKFGAGPANLTILKLHLNRELFPLRKKYQRRTTPETEAAPPATADLPVTENEANNEKPTQSESQGIEHVQ